MPKKKLLIWMTSMHLGGAERALVGLLHALDFSAFDVDLFLNRHEGELLGDIPSSVRLLPENPKYRSLAEPIGATLRRGQIGVAIGRTIGKWLAKRKARGLSNASGITVEYSHKYTKRWMPKVNPDTEYDLAISFITPHYFVAEKVRAKVKVAWIHTDYSKIALDVSSQLRMWSKYDRIASISDDVSARFCEIFPSLADKLIRIDNILPKDLILRQTEEPIEPAPDGVIRLLSIGRFTYAKNFENVPYICSELVRMGFPIRWELIGYGDGEKLIRDAIADAKMEEHVILVGKKSNPYPYLNRCDLYVQPSRFEGNCVSVREAQMLGKPVVITRYPTSGSQLEDGVDGVIVPLDNEDCARGIAELLRDPARTQQLSKTCQTRDYTNRAEAEKLQALSESN